MKHDPYRLSEPDRIGAHLRIACIAGIVSLLVHAALVFFLEDVPLSVWRTRSEQQERLRRKREQTLRARPLQPLPPPVDPLPAAPEEPFADATPSLSELVAKALPPPASLSLLPEAPVPHPEIQPPPDPAPETDPAAARDWMPRQEILEITEPKIEVPPEALPRWETVEIERTSAAPDYAPPVNPAEARRQTASAVTPPPVVSAPHLPAEPPPRLPETTPGILEAGTGEVAPPEVAEIFPPLPETEPPPRAIEQYLKVDLRMSRPSRDAKWRYFELRIDRLSESVLPVTPKDLLIIQDASASLAEERLFFCRRGWIEALHLLRPEDRFNVVSFRDDVAYCFPGWVDVSDENLAAAKKFIEGLRSSGGTDLYGSLREALTLPLREDRPAIALVVTDGHPTVGLTQSTDIIGKFAAENEGRLSVFTLGTQKRANDYLLDMLAFSNRGRGTLVEGGRWNIDRAIEEQVRRVGRPLLNHVRYRFDAKSGVEAYPTRSMNLYEDQPLILYGRCPADTPRLVFQVRGTARDVECDMIFDIDTRDAETVRGDALQTHWARLKMYELIVKYAMERSPEILDGMLRIHREFGIPIPYRGEFR